MITFTLNGELYEFDDNKLSLKEALAIKEHTGLGVRMFQIGLNMSEPAALQAMVWLAKKRSGVAIAFNDVDFDCYDLLSHLKNTALEAQRDAADPTAGPETTTGSGNGMTPEGAETPTSQPSPSTSE